MTRAPPAPRDAHTRRTRAPGYVDHVARLNKIAGQIRGISRMVTDDRYCLDVLTQISAATRALQEVALSLLENHVRGCVSSGGRYHQTQHRRACAPYILEGRGTCTETVRACLPLI
ncbi:metal-sensitive transcriptional regulator [Streptomyces sp. AS58]|uniref:metal-sensitive transcriptional regulator n=1 Tax=Streptomyces sp. AS58 TaxID=1519489 RepID=UPI00099CBF85|nr:metal-sensitive transcriptional regulator [Streptomyces sp. AS58]